jgi:hypothetical protein
VILGLSWEFWCYSGILVFLVFWSYLKAIVWSVYRKLEELKKSKVFLQVFGILGFYVLSRFTLLYIILIDSYTILFPTLLPIPTPSTILTPHVLSEWMVEVCAGY